MTTDQLGRVTADYGAKAVLRYREVADLVQDSSLPEIFLGSFIAGGIYDVLGLNAHVERYYTVIASEHEVTMPTNLVNIIGGYRADVAVYEKGKPKVIIELKLFDEGKRATSIVADVEKMAKLAALCEVESYVGVLGHFEVAQTRWF